jgi:hypothetical protein
MDYSGVVLMPRLLLLLSRDQQEKSNARELPAVA